MQQENDSIKLFKGIMVLTISSVITKILSAVYRVPFQNIVGDIGFYIYQQIYPIYGIVIALSTSGFPVVISKMAAERQASGKDEYGSFLRLVFIVLGAVSFCLFLAVFFGARRISVWMGDTALTPLIKTVSCSFLLMPFISTIRGNFQGRGNMIPTAVSQVLEQSIRVFLILILSFWMVHQGFSLYTTGQAAVFASVLGGAVSAIVLIFFFHKSRGNREHKLPVQWEEVKTICRVLLWEGTAICISALLLVMFQFVDALDIYALLCDSGLDVETAKKLKGIYDRGQPFLQLGTVVATSFALTLVPIITLEFKRGNRLQLEQKVYSAVKISTMIGAGAAVGLMNLMKFANIMLFENSEGTAVLTVFSISILFSTWILTLSGIFQGMGQVYAPAAYIAAGVALKFVLNEWWVARLGTMGAAAATVVSLLFISLLLMLKLEKAHFKPLPFRFYGKISLALLMMTGCLQVWMRFFTYSGMPGRMASIPGALGGVAVGGAVYILCVAAMGLLSDEEWSFIPFGNKLTGLRRKNWSGKDEP
ncbi:putative polysaccharide biosynthesis protein [Heyndrickxia acidiproducens]|uniref:putative polysaccharide biosynthesis protein n=1 Tax=Heyndrickxia acidiproducens TaxID=1121084 RepID=UPI0003602F20|nr:polysaccharide biosynthesis protein [Heyndrickxia acidiproducens]